MELPVINPEVSSAVKNFPPEAKEAFFELRELVYSAAADNKKIGVLHETLKWREPSYLTQQSKSGTTIRIAWNKKYPDSIGIYLNCKTTLVENIRTLFPDDFQFEGNRGLILNLSRPLPVDAILCCFEMALTYHLKAKK
ncbi:DUF1801 domain-containing protein [Aliikangiella coralliicola]|uniref:DUF1801 domain-containing protein n=1 Tax=Aliikangiella coralliicola TaxID=2592383 RepID=A0A545UF36_9GAMM|nr:DUF1801 domain-containing protein [Aliikangiella coralliicola]TQV88092.1 DUF1801 domain-containing protein [Aliikangiella coralliicola]